MPTDLTRVREAQLPWYIAPGSMDPYIYTTGTPLFLDFETTNIQKGSPLVDENRPVFLSVKWKGKWFSREVSGPDDDLEWLESLLIGSDFIVAHNAKFDLQWLKRCGFDIGGLLVFDTQLAEHVLGGNRYRVNNLSLDDIAGRRFGLEKDVVVKRLIKAGVCPSQIPLNWLARYADKDVELTERLFYTQLEELNARLQLPVVYTRCLLTPVLADMEFNGLWLDEEQVLPYCREIEEKSVQANFLLSKITGDTNLNSPKQLGELIYDKLGFAELTDRSGNPVRTESGARSTSADTIEALKPRNKRQATFKELFGNARDYSSALSKYLTKFRGICERGNPRWRLRASFNQASTGTHRLSSTGPGTGIQFQNLPRAYKRFFRPNPSLPNGRIGEADGAQLEFRIAGHLGRDRAILGDVVSGADIHSTTASIIGVSRQDAKAHTFKPLYGGRSGTPNERAYYAYFRERYSQLTAEQDRWVSAVLSTGELLTEWGMRYYWTGVKVTESGYITHSTEICNYPVQALATAEIIPIALVYVHHLIRVMGLPITIVNTVHDSIICEFSEELSEDFRVLIRYAMTECVYRYLEEVYNLKLTVPLGCGIKIGERWGQGSEEKYESPEELWLSNAKEQGMIDA